jgi:hypothetical protein
MGEMTNQILGKLKTGSKRQQFLSIHYEFFILL